MDRRIERLESEEREAVRRRDWATAARRVAEKAALKEAQEPRASVGKGR